MQFAARRQQGMTLIEILVVLVLIGIVMGVVAGNFIGRGEEAKRKAAKIEIEQIGQTLDLYKLETGRYPTTQEGLQALISAPPGVNNWNGPYWKKSTLPKDPWGNEKAGFELQTKLNRKDFGMVWNAALDTGGFILGDDVTVSINLETLREKAPTEK